jgi:hypothetical protein
MGRREREEGGGRREVRCRWGLIDDSRSMTPGEKRQSSTVEKYTCKSL